MKEKKRKLTYKEREFVKNFTNPKDQETFLNATQSAKAAYNATLQSAGQIGHVKLKKVEVQEAIKKRISTKDEDQQTITKYVDKLDAILTGETTPENAVFIREMRELIKLNGQFRGDFVEKTLNLNVNASISAKESKDLSTDDLINALSRR